MFFRFIPKSGANLVLIFEFLTKFLFFIFIYPKIHINITQFRVNTFVQRFANPYTKRRRR
jgi:hypothetical protein